MTTVPSEHVYCGGFFPGGKQPINYMLLFLGIYQRRIDPCKLLQNTAGKVTSPSACLGENEKEEEEEKNPNQTKTKPAAGFFCFCFFR